MATEYSIACSDSFEFIELDGWPIIDEVGHRLHRGRKLALLEYCGSPSVIIDKEKILFSIDSQKIEDQHDYIQELIPIVRKFVCDQGNNNFFITCDVGGTQPWEIGASIWFKWKEVISVFDFYSHFLPRNLIDDYKLFSWDEVLEFYQQKASWMLDEQLKEDLHELKLRYSELLNRT